MSEDQESIIPSVRPILNPNGTIFGPVLQSTKVIPAHPLWFYRGHLEPFTLPKLVVKVPEPWFDENSELRKDSPPEDYGSDLITIENEEIMAYTFYVDSVAWDDTDMWRSTATPEERQACYDRMDKSGDGSKENPWRNVCYALDKLDCVRTQQYVGAKRINEKGEIYYYSQPPCPCRYIRLVLNGTINYAIRQYSNILIPPDNMYINFILDCSNVEINIERDIGPVPHEYGAEVYVPSCYIYQMTLNYYIKASDYFADSGAYRTCQGMLNYKNFIYKCKINIVSNIDVKGTTIFTNVVDDGHNIYYDCIFNQQIHNNIKQYTQSAPTFFVYPISCDYYTKLSYFYKCNIINNIHVISYVAHNAYIRAGCQHKNCLIYGCVFQNNIAITTTANEDINGDMSNTASNCTIYNCKFYTNFEYIEGATGFWSSMQIVNIDATSSDIYNCVSEILCNGDQFYTINNLIKSANSYINSCKFIYEVPLDSTQQESSRGSGIIYIQDTDIYNCKINSTFNKYNVNTNSFHIIRGHCENCEIIKKGYNGSAVQAQSAYFNNCKLISNDCLISNCRDTEFIDCELQLTGMNAPVLNYNYTIIAISGSINTIIRNCNITGNATCNGDISFSLFSGNTDSYIYNCTATLYINGLEGKDELNDYSIAVLHGFSGVIDNLTVNINCTGPARAINHTACFAVDDSNINNLKINMTTNQNALTSYFAHAKSCLFQSCDNSYFYDCEITSNIQCNDLTSTVNGWFLWDVHDCYFKQCTCTIKYQGEYERAELWSNDNTNCYIYNSSMVFDCPPAPYYSICGMAGKNIFLFNTSYDECRSSVDEACWDGNYHHNWCYCNCKIEND